MNFIQTLRSNILYVFMGLPIIIMLYEFFLSCSLMNRNVMILFLGQVAIVPIVALIMTFLHDFLNNTYGTVVWILLSAFFFYLSFFIFNNYQPLASATVV